MCSKISAVLSTATATAYHMVWYTAVLWIPGMILMAVSNDHEHGELIGFILLMLAYALIGCGFLYGCCTEPAVTLTQESSEV